MHMRWLTAGESHGQALSAIVEGIPASVSVTTADIDYHLERRRLGVGRGARQNFEADKVSIIGGVRLGKTQGGPVSIQIANSEWPKWEKVMSADPVAEEEIKDLARNAPLTRPRPGHADFTAHHKFGGFEDYRGGGHFSGRLTAALVGAGVVAKKLLNAGKVDEKIKVEATIVSIGGESDVEKGIQKAIEQKDSVGGIVECVVKGLPIGLGEHFFNSVESLISHAVFAIPAIRGIEFGTGFAAASMFGVDHNDAIVDASGKTKTNHAGGVVGGYTNGNDLVFRIAVKPTSSTPKEQITLNWETNEQETFSVKGRHDLCIALRVPVVLEAVTAIVLADLMLIDQIIPRIIKK